MSGTSETSPRPTSTDLRNVTFSQALADGLSASEWLIGPTTDPSGQARVHVSHLVSPERVEGLTMRDTCGPLFGGSSPSADLQASLANRLQAATGVNGSPEYTLTWKQWDMFAGLQICALRASARPTSDSDCGGWPTVTALVGYGTDDSPTNQRNSPSTSTLVKGWTSPIARDHKGHTKTEAHPEGFTQTLANDVEQAGWPTPMSSDQNDRQKSENWQGGDLPSMSKLTGAAQSGGPVETGKQGEFLPDGWRTPTEAETHNQDYSTQIYLQNQAQTAGWVSPTSQDHSRGSKPPRPQDRGVPLSQQATIQNLRLPDMEGWKLNPRFSLWLMGYPDEWACCGERAMQSYRKSRKRSSKQQKAQEKK